MDGPHTHSLASIEPTDPLYEDVETSNGQKKRVRVSLSRVRSCLGGKGGGGSVTDSGFDS